MIAGIVSFFRFYFALSQQTCDIIAPNRVTALDRQGLAQVVVFGILCGFSSRIRNKTANVPDAMMRCASMIRYALTYNRSAMTIA